MFPVAIVISNLSALIVLIVGIFLIIVGGSLTILNKPKPSEGGKIEPDWKDSKMVNKVLLEIDQVMNDNRTMLSSLGNRLCDHFKSEGIPVVVAVEPGPGTTPYKNDFVYYVTFIMPEGINISSSSAEKWANVFLPMAFSGTKNLAWRVVYTTREK